MPNIYDYAGPRCTRDHFEIVSIVDGERAPSSLRADTLTEAREIADRMASGRSDRPSVIELDFRQRIADFVTDRNCVIIETVRVENMTTRVFE
jgi:hypothetical protein